MPVMPVKRAKVAVFVHQLADVAKISAKFFGSNGSIVPSFPFGRHAGRERGRARARFADVPHGAGFGSGVDARIRRIGNALETFDELRGEILGLLRIVCAEFDKQDGLYTMYLKGIENMEEVTEELRCPECDAVRDCSDFFESSPSDS